jgi:hypothetical protein
MLGRDPVGRLVSAHRGDLAAPKRLHGCCSGRSVGTARRIPAFGRGLQPGGVRAVIGVQLCCRGCLSAWGLIAGVGVDVSLSAVLGFVGDQPSRRQTYSRFPFALQCPRTLCVRQIPFTGTPTDRGEKMAVHMGGYQCRL